ncbi:MerR family transcriptional regulator [Enterococcus mundtii]|uniref:Excisionase n=1 Tax=Enterococcus mundtii TaxID=53346 RepID=A0A2S7RUC3_ENTMU|nr:helix-turn-helix domain-containing protein [Enterococcus mundtii]MBO1087055.1 helix-turn-helix domain-containing protein [Enterococcus mundtii]PQF23396.1 excisionase [Enterococcus mundtii]
MINLALVNLDDLKILLSENSIPNEVWNSKQAADYLTVSVPTLHKEAELGKVPGVRIGKDWKFSSIALYQYVSKKEESK